MVQVTTTHRASYPSEGFEQLGSGQGTPQIHVHHVHRDVHGNGIAIRAYGEIKIAAGEFVWAHELKMNTLQVLTLTPEPCRQMNVGYSVHKSIWHKGEYDNYASIDVFDNDGNFQAPGTPPVDGSIWLNFVAVGE